MPKLNIDDFSETPKIGDTVNVTGKVKSIDENSGEVEVSYDEITLSNKTKTSETENTSNDESQSLDNALSQAFPQNQ